MGNEIMKRGSSILLIGSCLFIFMLVSLLLMSQSLQNSDLFDRYYSILLGFNILGLLSLIILILLNVKRLIRQLKNKIVGARMTIRMVIIFSVLSVTPVLIVYYFSLDFLHRGIDSWFDLRVEEALDDSLELSRLALDVRMRELLNTTEQAAKEINKMDGAAIPFEIDQIRERINANELTLMTRRGAVIVSSSSDTSSLVPNVPDESILLQLFQGKSYINLDIIKTGGLMIRAVVNLPAVAVAKELRIIHALFPISGRINDLTKSVQSAYIEYKELSYLREQLKISFIIILTLVLLFSIFSALWAAFYSANKLSAPIKDLAGGTRAISQGDYNTRLPIPSNDELGFLVASFNEMTDKISRSRDTAKKSQQEAESQRTFLEAVLSCLSSGVMVFNTEGILEKSNISSAAVLQIDIVDTNETSISSLTEKYPWLQPFFECLSRNIAEQQDDWREQVTIIDKSDEQILMISGTSLKTADNQISSHVIVFDEVTALIKGQRDAAWREMARRLAHEIKNPLTPIQLAAERLRHKYLSTMGDAEADTLNRMTNTIVQQVETMKDMVNSFSDYARSPEFEPKEINLEKVLEEVVDLFSNVDFGNAIESEIEPNLPNIVGDEKKLRQVFNNLLANAVYANKLNNVSYLKIIVSNISNEKQKMIEVRILDGGSGIKEEVARKLFEPYMTTKQKGTGLGLAIVKRIIDEHGGQVWLENNKGQTGVCAVIRLPVNASGFYSNNDTQL